MKSYTHCSKTTAAANPMQLEISTFQKTQAFFVLESSILVMLWLLRNGSQMLLTSLFFLTIENR